MAYKDPFTEYEAAGMRAGRASGAATGRATGAAKGGGWGTAGGAIVGGVGGFFLGGTAGAKLGVTAGAAAGGAAGTYFGGKSGAKKGGAVGTRRGIAQSRAQFQKEWKARKKKEKASGITARASIEQANVNARMTDDQMLAQATVPKPKTARGGSQLQQFKNRNFPR